jgi:hypothetical protein
MRNRKLSREMERLRAEIPMPLLLESYGARIFNAGWRGWHPVRCPFHDDRRPSATCTNTYFRCFACDVGGDIFDVVMHAEGVDLRGAVEWLRRNRDAVVA